MSLPATTHPIKHLRTKLIAVAVLLGVVVVGRLATSWVSALLVRRPDSAAPKPSPYNIHGLTDQDPHVRLRSVQVLGPLNLGNTFVVAKLADLVVTDSDPLVRAEAAKHIIMDPQARTTQQVLFKAIEDDNPVVRRHVLMALARIGDAGRPAMPQMAQFLNDSDEYSRCAAATALHVLDADSQPPITVLLQMLKDEDPITRQWAAAVSGDFRIEAAIPLLREMLQTEPDVASKFDVSKRAMDGRAREEAEKALERINSTPPTRP